MLKTSHATAAKERTAEQKSLIETTASLIRVADEEVTAAIAPVETATGRN